MVNLTRIKAVNVTSLSTEQRVELNHVLDMAKTDQFIGTEEKVIREGEQRIAVLDGSSVVGFYSPKRQSLSGTTYWRAGALYLVEAARGQGIMEYVLKDFFVIHSPGLVWIDDTNDRSIGLFKKLGFVQDKAYPGQDGKTGHWYIKRISAALESLPAYFRW